MKIDADRCVGHGRCYTVAPEVYESDEVGFNAHRGSEVEVADGDAVSAWRGSASCPEDAISVLETRAN